MNAKSNFLSGAVVAFALASSLYPVEENADKPTGQRPAVTLRGPVNREAKKHQVAAIASGIVFADRVNNQLEVKRANQLNRFTSINNKTNLNQER